MTVKPPAPPYLGPAAHTSGGGNKPIKRIVIHCTVSPLVKGQARATAAYFRSKSAGGSAHYVVDADEAVQVVYDGTIAWHAPPNGNSLGIELCDSLSSPAWDKANAKRWGDADHAAMLHRAAALTAQLCLAYDVPIERLSVSDLKNGRHGICGHVDVSQAWHQSSHWDPGPSFPWDSFMGMVRAEAKRLNAPEAPKPDPKPVATPTTYPVQHVTHNIRHALSPADVTATLDRLASSTADIIVLQEMSGRRGLVEAVQDFGSYMADLPDVRGEGGCVTLWRESEFELVRGRVFGVGAGGPVPARAAGPSRRGPEFYTITSLRHLKTRRVIHAVNLHLPPSLGIKEMRAIAEAVGKDLDERLSAFKGQVIVAGDMNTQRPLTLLDPDGNSGLVDTSEQLGSLITHEPTKRDIDRVLYRGDALEAVSQRLIPDQPSDHIPRLTRFALKEK